MSRTAEPKRCGTACQFIRPNYPAMERAVHGRARDSERPDENHFGPFQRMLTARLSAPLAGAQWSGITTRLAARLLESGAVDAVVTMRSAADNRWQPEPVLVTDPAELATCRGMKMGYAPLLALLEPAIARGLTRVAVVGIPCQIYPLRAIQATLGLERLYVIGTPCSDNTHTKSFEDFLARLSDEPESIVYLEFLTDYHVEIRFADGRRRRIPFLSLPIADLPSDFFPLTCRTCVDYTNVLADITVGYMGGDGQQWLLVRNDRGAEMLELLAGELDLAAPISRGRRQGPVRGFLENTRRAAGGLPVRRAPRWVRPLISWLMPRTGPRGVEFARARVEMKAVETVLHLRRQLPKRLKSMVPAHVWALTKAYGLVPADAESNDENTR
ncbi:MAG: Coenzyme F420 hydrogenase/dehydrogenase, beta subunit C-terminal domain [Pseudomonadota bacterium]